MLAARSYFQPPHCAWDKSDPALAVPDDRGGFSRFGAGTAGHFWQHRSSAGKNDPTRAELTERQKSTDRPVAVAPTVIHRCRSSGRDQSPATMPTKVLTCRSLPNGPTGRLSRCSTACPAASQGSGLLDIREFQVAATYSAVLQVVEDGFATSVTLADGEQAVYVDGMWVQRMLDHTPTFIWQTGTHCLLIMERQGVVIWMVGDPRDGLTMQSMSAIANQLVPVNRATLMRNYRGVWLASASLVVSVNNALGSECYLLVPQGISPASGAGEFVFSGSGTGIGIGPSPGP